MILAALWSALLESFRPVFRRRGTFTLFTVLATGLVLQASVHTQLPRTVWQLSTVKGTWQGLERPPPASDMPESARWRTVSR